MSNPRLEYLFDRYMRQACTPEEEAELMALWADPANAARIKELMEPVIRATGAEQEMPEGTAAAILEAVFQSDSSAALPAAGSSRPAFRRMWWQWAAAAVVVGLLAGGAYRWMKEQRPAAPIAPANVIADDVQPGGNKATLTLADGTVITLDSAGNGALAHQGSTRVVKLDNGQLGYQQAAGSPVGKVQYNLLATPRGGQYRVTLPDGTGVWLNAASSLRYPTAFTGTERRVELKGEAYFEVAKQASMPFRVDVDGNAVVEVLGTSFNVNAYTDEDNISTTLIDGRVRVSKAGVMTLLKPGQQARVPFGAAAAIPVYTVDAEEAIAWKNGLFRFNNADLPAVMRQLSRWYDVDVVYEGSIPPRKFEGEIQRDLSLSDVLEALGKNKVHFRIAGKKIILTP